MAVLESIRRRTGLLLIFVAGALILFLLTDWLKSDRSGASSRDLAGTIGDNEISSIEYRNAVDERMIQVKQNYQAQGQQMPPYMDQSIKEQVWNEFIQKYGNTSVYENAGVIISGDEKDDMLDGVTMDEAVKSAFKNQDGSFSVDSAKARVEELNETLDESMSARWNSFKSSVQAQRLQNKYANIFSKSAYVTKEEAKKKYYDDNSKVSFDYAYIPFSSLEDSVVEVTDQDLELYLTGHKKEFDFKSGRVLKYMVFNIEPSGADSTAALKAASKLATAFGEAPNDTIFFRANSNGTASPIVSTMDNLPSDLKIDSAYIKKGFVKGPVLTHQGYEITKVLGVEEVEKVESAHILIAHKADTAKTRELALEVLTKAKNGEEFNDLVKQYSEGPSKDKNGELGAVKKGNLVKPFEEAIFAMSEEGLVPEVVETSFGFHIIKVLKPKYPETEIVTVKIVKPIKASKNTKRQIRTKALQFVAGVENIEGLEKKTEAEDSKELLETPLLTPSSSSLGSVFNAEEIVRWGFGDEIEVGDVAPKVFKAGNKYVIAALFRITDKNNPTVDDARDQIEILARARKKGTQLKAMLESTTGDLHEKANKLNEDHGEGFCKFGNIKDHPFSSNYINGIGKEPSMVGTAIALDEDSFSPTTIIGEGGVFIVRTTAKSEATNEVADYTSLIKKIEQENPVTAQTSSINNAIKDYVGVEDKRR